MRCYQLARIGPVCVAAKRCDGILRFSIIYRLIAFTVLFLVELRHNVCTRGRIEGVNPESRKMLSFGPTKDIINATQGLMKTSINPFHSSFGGLSKQWQLQ